MKTLSINSTPPTTHTQSPVKTTTGQERDQYPDPKYEMGTVPAPSKESKGERNARNLHRS